MATNHSLEEAQRLILDAIRHRDPNIAPGGIFDWLMVRTRLRHDLSDEQFSAAMFELGAEELIGANAERRAFTLTEKGHQAMLEGGAEYITLDAMELS